MIKINVVWLTKDFLFQFLNASPQLSPIPDNFQIET